MSVLLKAACCITASSVALLSAGAALAQAPSFIAFESGPVRPLALSADGRQLYACNIPDGQLEIYDVGSSGLTHRSSVAVGMEPVAVAARSASEVWVVNHLSDSVSVVDVAASPPRVVRTLVVGDEPRDIVFAANGRAFITTAHRGEQRVDPSLDPVPFLGADWIAWRSDGDPELASPGVGRADVWVFDPKNLGDAFGGIPVGVATLFGDTPRALAVNGDTVYVAVFHSGNQTTVVTEGAVCDGLSLATSCPGDGVTSPNGLPNGQLPGGVLPPATNHQNVRAPEVGLMVRFDNATGQWRDEARRNWSNAVRFSLPDLDVFSIDAGTLANTGRWAHVGTTLFNMAVHPVSGKVYVSNTDSQNMTRFEGAGSFGKTTVQGNLAQARISILEAGSKVAARHLNSHIDYRVRPAPAAAATHSLATPLDMAFSSNGSTLYVAAYGSSTVGVIPTASLEAGSFNPATQSANYIRVTGGGPAGLALDEHHGRLYVLTRFDNGVSVVNLTSRHEDQHLRMHNPEPPEVVQGRPFLYDARLTSSNGEASCASCHIFADMDQLAWDLGDPDANVTANPLLIKMGLAAVISDQNGGAENNQFHPMKGPMTTQTLKGLVNAGHMHWRGDRVTGRMGTENRAEPPFDSALSFRNFIDATVALNGRAEAISAADMEKFTRFVMRLTLPPNPIRRLDNNLNDQHRQLTNIGSPYWGREFFFGRVGAATIPEGHAADGVPQLGFIGLGFTCEGCHTTEPANGYFGTDGTASFESLTQILKIPHLRNLYQKVGMFGHPMVPILAPNASGQPFIHQGDQVRGYGYMHEGTADTIFTFLQAGAFIGFESDQQRRDAEAYMLTFDADLAPITGQQVTLTQTNAASADPRIDLFMLRAAAPFTSKILGGTRTECDLIAKTTVNARQTGFVRRADGRFYPDDGSAALTDAQLRAIAIGYGHPVTYTCAPPGSGQRMGVDRDLDGALDGRDNCPAAANADQRDEDGNGVGDVCENAGEPGGGCGGSVTANSKTVFMPVLLLGSVLVAMRRRRRRSINVR
jgi:DNA-binding beta-propeller fold protein YncE